MNQWGYSKRKSAGAIFRLYRLEQLDLAGGWHRWSGSVYYDYTYADRWFARIHTGGMKTTILAVLFANGLQHLKDAKVLKFGRRIDSDVVKNAATILMMYLTLFICGGVIISVIEGIPVGTCLFETASAVGTVGLTLGITSQLGIVSQIILMILMFFGRVGGLTLIYAALSGVNKNLSKLPQEKIVVG